MARSPWCPSRYVMAIYALNEYMTGKVWSPNGLSEAMATTIGVDQGYLLSPTLSGLYIDEVSHYIERFGDSAACLPGIAYKYYYMLMILC